MIAGEMNSVVLQQPLTFCSTWNYDFRSTKVVRRISTFNESYQARMTTWGVNEGIMYLKM